MTITKSTKRSDIVKQPETHVEGLDLTSDDNKELLGNRGNSKTSSNSTKANLIPEMNEFTLSHTLTKPSPLLQGSHQQNDSVVNDIRQSPLVNIQAWTQRLHNPNSFASRHQYHPHHHRRTLSTTHSDIRSMRSVRHPTLRFLTHERQELIESNLRRSEVLRRQMQVIEYELFIISKNISKLQE